MTYVKCIFLIIWLSVAISAQKRFYNPHIEAEDHWYIQKNELHQTCIHGPLHLASHFGDAFIDLADDGLMCWSMSGRAYWLVDLGGGLMAVNEKGEFFYVLTWTKPAHVEEFNFGVH